jgi:uncharacterized protein
MYDGPIIDAHTHPALGPEEQLVAHSQPPEEYRVMVRGAGITHAAAIAVAPAGDLERTRTRNDAVLTLSAGSGGFFLPVCSVHPADGEAALAELDRVAAAGCRWLKLHPMMQAFDLADPAVGTVVRRAAELRLPVLFHADFPLDPAEPGKFVKLALSSPQARLILAHAHGPSFSQLLIYHQLARYPWWQRRVWVDISATASMLADGPFAEQFVWTLRKFGMDRVLFGSNYPIDDPLEAIKAVHKLGLTDGELQAVMHDNAAGLLAG